MICKKTIAQRKAIYGNNFEDIAILWNEYFSECGILNDPITEEDVAKSMALMKQTRINSIKARLQELKESPSFSDYVIQVQIKDLNNALKDSKIDFENYNWIANNYDEYEVL